MAFHEAAAGGFIAVAPRPYQLLVVVHRRSGRHCTMGSLSSTQDETTWTGVLDAARPDDAVAEQQALADVKANLFGRPRQSVVLSRYVLLEKIGSGALGVVYAAYDPELDRKVAIKLLRNGPRQRPRLVAEARAMAKVDHPNVMAVHDVGLYDEPGPPSPGVDRHGVFVVMDLVEGVDLFSWCRQAGRSRDRVVAAFVGAGRGLAAAHAAGLVHRDFKPANVLVDAEGRVRVLDFGLARADSRAAPSDTPSPQEARDDRGSGSTRGVGTPAYMAPEQHRGHAIDARADQFAFCVSLYEALHGTRPFVGADLLAAKLAGPPADTVEPADLNRIVQRGLSPEPSDRYPTMDALLLDLDRRRGARRLVAGGAVLVMAGAGAFAMLERPGACDDGTAIRQRIWGADRRAMLSRQFERSGAAYAEQVWPRVDTGVSRYLDRWAAARVQACERDAATPRSVAAANRERRCLDRGPEAVDALAEVLSTANASDVENAVALVERLPSLSTCEAGGVVAVALPRALTVAQTLFGVARYEAALRAGNELLEQATEPGVRARASLVIAKSHNALGARSEAREAFFGAQSLAESADDVAAGFDVAVGLAALAIDEAHFEDALRWLDLADDRAERAGVPEEHRLVAAVQRGRLAYHRGDDASGVALASDLLQRATAAHGETHSLVAQALSSRGRARARRGESEDARDDFARALAVFRSLLGDDHPTTAQALENYGTALLDTGDLDAGLAAFADARVVIERTLGADSLRVATLDLNRAAALADADQLVEAATLTRRVVDRLRKAGNAPTTLGPALLNLSNLLVDTGQLDEAIATAEEALAVLLEIYGTDHPTTLVAEASRARAWLAAGRRVQARAALLEIKARMVAVLGPDYPNLAQVELLLEQSEDVTPPAD
ncbi:MAG: serine/threonine-protein kinase [Myxococcota bacterium]